MRAAEGFTKGCSSTALCLSAFSEALERGGFSEDGEDTEPLPVFLESLVNHRLGLETEAAGFTAVGERGLSSSTGASASKASPSIDLDFGGRATGTEPIVLDRAIACGGCLCEPVHYKWRQESGAAAIEAAISYRA